MSYSVDVARAEELARKAHAFQTDKAGMPYINHPERVAGRLETLEEKVVGWLHDVVEDTAVTLKDIAEQFGSETAEAVDHVTHRKGEAWSDYLIRAKSNPVARKVKISDLIDNSNLSRISHVSEKDIKRTEKYIRALYFLMDIDK